MTDHKEPVCVDVLSEMVKSPIKTDAHSKRVLTQLTTCFIDVARLVYRLDQKVYADGNGKGIAGQVQTLTDEWKEIKPLMVKLAKAAERLEEEEKKPDPFRSLVKYVTDKILPPLIVSAVVGYAAFQLALYVFLKTKP